MPLANYNKNIFKRFWRPNFFSRNYPCVKSHVMCSRLNLRTKAKKSDHALEKHFMLSD